MTAEMAPPNGMLMIEHCVSDTVMVVPAVPAGGVLVDDAQVKEL